MTSRLAAALSVDLAPDPGDAWGPVVFLALVAVAATAGYLVYQRVTHGGPRHPHGDWHSDSSPGRHERLDNPLSGGGDPT